MANLAIDLSGLKGLANKYHGDLQSSVAQPHLRYLASDGQFVSGIYNPFRNYGYISPANKSITNVTGTITNHIISSEYSSSKDVIYLAQDSGVLSTLDGMDDLSVTNTTILPSTSTFKDLELYEINGFEALYYTYRYLETSTNVYNINLGWRALNTNEGAYQIDCDIQSITATDNTVFIEMSGNINSNQKLAQKFRTQDFNLSNSTVVSGIRLGLKMPFTGSTQTWTLQVRIETASAGLPSGTAVSGTTVTLAASSLPVGYVKDVFFEFSAPVTLTADTDYFIVIEPTVLAEMGSNEGVQWLSSIFSSNPYSSGITKQYNNSAWEMIAIGNQSFDFSLINNIYNFVGYIDNPRTEDFNRLEFGTSESTYTALSTTISDTITVSTKNNPLVIALIHKDTTTDEITGVTCNGVAMNRYLKNALTGFSDTQYVYYLTGVSDGTATITATSSTAREMSMMTATYYGVDQSNPLNATDFYEEDNVGGISFTASLVDTDNKARYGRYFAWFVSHNGTNLGGSITSDLVIETADTSIFSALIHTYNPIYPNDINYETGTSAFLFANSSIGGVPDWASSAFSIQAADTTKSTDLFSQVSISDDVPAFIKKADNGILYWFTGNRVHAFDGGFSGGVTGTLSPDALLFPDYINCVDALDTNGYMYIAIQSGVLNSTNTIKSFGEDIAGVYIWDRQTTITRTRDFIPLIGVKEIKKIYQTREGVVRVICINNDRKVEIREIVNSTFVPIETLSENAFPAYRDAIRVINNIVVWQGYDGKIYAHGRATPKDPEGLYIIGDLSVNATGTYTPGILHVGDENSTTRQAIFASWKDDSTNKLSKWYPHGTGTIDSVTQQANQGDIYTPVYFLPSLSNVKRLVVYCVPSTNTSTDTVATIKVYFNQSTTATYPTGLTKTVALKDIKRGYVSMDLNAQNINSIQVEIEYPTNTTLGDDDFRPSVAVLEYDSTTAYSKSTDA